MKLLDQTLNRLEEGGRQWLDYRLTVRHSKVPDPMYLLFRVDPKTMLPHLCRVEGKWQGKSVTTEQRLDYPAQGPASVYELGVPQTAKLVDRVPSDDIVRILETIRAGRQRMDDYRATVVDRMDDPDNLWWINERPMMFYRKGDKTRVDNALWTGDYPFVDKPADGANMEKWWRKRAEDFVFCPFYITHGPTVFYITTGVKTDDDGKNTLVVESADKRDTNQLPGETFPPYYSRSPESRLPPATRHSATNVRTNHRNSPRRRTEWFHPVASRQERTHARRDRSESKKIPSSAGRVSILARSRAGLRGAPLRYGGRQ